MKQATGQAAERLKDEVGELKAKRELAWTLRYPSWRGGFVAAYAATTATDREARLATQRGGM